MNTHSRFLSRLAPLTIMAMIVTACLSPPADLSDLEAGSSDVTEATETTEATPTTETTAVADDHEGDEGADHHDEDADHEGDEDADHHDEDADHEGDEAADGEIRTVEVLMTEHAFDPSSFTVKEGETVQFLLKNEGEDEHEFRLTTMHAAEEHIASGHEGHDDEAGEGGHGHDELLMVVPAGQTRVFTVTFEHAGEFDVVACLIPGHFENGMLAELTYED